MKTKKLLTATLVTAILCLTFATMLVDKAEATTTYNRNLYFHKVSSKTLWSAGNTTTQIMNTKSTGNWSTSTQYINVILAANNTLYNTTFWLYPKFAHNLVLQGTFNITLYLKANKTVTSDFYLRTTVIETTSSGANSTAITLISGALSLSTSYVAKSHTGGLASPGHTFDANGYIQLKLGFNTTGAAPLNVTLAYDSATYPSKLKVPAVDHLDITSIGTYSGAISQTDFSYMDTINLTTACASAFGGYDIASVSVWYVPIGTSTQLPSGKGTASKLSGDDDDYNNYWSYSYTYGQAEYTGTLWTPYVNITDRDGNTYQETGSRIGITGPGGEAPPPWSPYVPNIFYELGLTPELALIVMIVIAGISVILLSLLLYLLLASRK